MNKKEVDVLVLFDSSTNRYLGRNQSNDYEPVFVDREEEAYQFSEKEIEKAWLTAYKLAWKGHGQFFVYGCPNMKVVEEK